MVISSCGKAMRLKKDMLIFSDYLMNLQINFAGLACLFFFIMYIENFFSIINNYYCLTIIWTFFLHNMYNFKEA